MRVSMLFTHCFFFFFFNDTATTEIYTLSLHDALPILQLSVPASAHNSSGHICLGVEFLCDTVDRKSTRLNSSHLVISYAVFCLKKKKNHHVALFVRITSTLYPLGQLDNPISDDDCAHV